MSEIFDILEQIERAKAQNERLLLVIDGKCGSGKTTFAEKLYEHYKCNVFHIDDFYLPIAMQTQEVMSKPGGNINFERFIEDVMIPLKISDGIDYKPFLCRNQNYAPNVRMEKTNINIIEGTYSCHPTLREFYAQMKCDSGIDNCAEKEQYPKKWNVITMFLDIDEENQIKRLKKRVGEERFKIFEDKWIPREMEYFKVYDVKEYCDYSIPGTDESIGGI